MSTPNQSADYRALLQEALLQLQALRSELDACQHAPNEPLAIIGLGCRLPGARSPGEFWELLHRGTDAVTEVPPTRWDADAFYDPDPRAPGKTTTRWGGFLAQIDQFDPYFFGISPREATCMDPQQRLLLELTWEALEDAGQVVDRLHGSQTGVFLGIFNSDYAWLQLANPQQIDVYSAAGSGHGIAANRLSYLFDFHGPSLAVDTACSSSLVAFHLACQSLRSGECDLALAAGVNLLVSPLSTVSTSKVLAMAADGRCKAFDARADGIVRSEGGGVVVLKRLADALAAGDPIRAVVRGTAVNQDGRSAGLTAPNVLAQQAVIQRALTQAGVAPEQISYVEAHGTGTALGDPIEIEALSAVLGRSGSAPQRCAIGSVKSNLGHLEAAAGIAGLIKTVLALQHQAIPASLHFEQLNPNIVLDTRRFFIPTSVQPWAVADGPRLAGVSSFGAGGTNAHVILEEAPPPREPTTQDARAQLLVLSAHTSPARQALAQAYQTALAAPPLADARLADVCFTAAARRSHHHHRLAVVGETQADIILALQGFTAGEGFPGAAGATPDRRRGLAFVFSGQGAQWVGMGQTLLRDEPVFRRALERCASAFAPVAPWSLLDELLADAGHSRLVQTEIAQPVIFAVQVALADLWQSWGIVPDAVVGHSVGEIAAAHVAGVLSLQDAARVAYHRGRLMQRATGLGSMVAVDLPAAQAAAAIAMYGDRLAIAAVNAPGAVVLAGDHAALAAVVDELQRQQVSTRPLRVNYAFHTHHMDGLGAELAALCRDVQVRPASRLIVSTLSGQPATPQDFGPAYWARQLREPVQFAAAMASLFEHQVGVCLEVAGHPVLAQAMAACAHGRDVTILPSLLRQQAERARLLASLGTLYTLGYPIDWAGLHPNGGHCVTLPAYPWQRERYWTEVSEDDGRWAHYLVGGRSSADQPSGDASGALASDQPLDRAALRALEVPRRRTTIETYLGRQLSRVLKTPVARLDLDQPLIALGIDSLVGVQLKDTVEREFGLVVPIADMLQGLTPRQLASRICDAVVDDTPAVLISMPDARQPAAANGTHSPPGTAAAELLAGIDHFSGDEVDRLLDQLLAPRAAELAGRTAVITGGSRGIGAAIAVALGQRAANVVINYHSDPAAAEETAAAVSAAGGQAVIVKANVGDPAQVAALVEAATRSFGGVDILIGNAASGVPRPLLEQNDRAWDYTLDINARSILRGAWAAAPGMQARGWGRIIALTSIGAGRVLPNYGVVGVSKAAIESLIRYLAAELAPYGICCNAVSPGLIVTDSVKYFPNLDQLVAAALMRSPSGQLVTLEQVAAVVAFLCTDAAAGIVGQTIVVDGGYAVMA